FLRSNASARCRVREVHPEVCFYFMANCRTMSASKKKAAGRSERLRLLTSAFAAEVEVALADCQHLGCQPDDLLDAFAALWTARRIRDGLAETIGGPTERDRFGFPMEIVA